MIKSIAPLIFLLAITGLLWFANINYSYIYLEKSFYSFLALTIIHLVFKIGIESTEIKKIKESKARYSFRKVISIIYFIVLLVVVVRIWV